MLSQSVTQKSQTNFVRYHCLIVSIKLMLTIGKVERNRVYSFGLSSALYFNSDFFELFYSGKEREGRGGL